MPTKKSTVISIRLNPAVEEDQRVLDILNELQERGFSHREIITDAILRAEGHTPEMYHDADGKVTRHILELMLSEFAREIVDNVRQFAPQTTQKASPHNKGESDDEYANNLAKGFLTRRKRGQG